MPLEIRELIIRATVADLGSGTSAASSNTEGSPDEKLLNDLAEKIFEIIREKQER